MYVDGDEDKGVNKKKTRIYILLGSIHIFAAIWYFTIVGE